MVSVVDMMQTHGGYEDEDSASWKFKGKNISECLVPTISVARLFGPDYCGRQTLGSELLIFFLLS